MPRIQLCLKFKQEMQFFFWNALTLRISCMHSMPPELLVALPHSQTSCPFCFFKSPISSAHICSDMGSSTAARSDWQGPHPTPEGNWPSFPSSHQLSLAKGGASQVPPSSRCNAVWIDRVQVTTQAVTSQEQWSRDISKTPFPLGSP